MEDVITIIQGCIRKEPKYQRLFYDRYRGFACKIVFRYIFRYDKAMDIVTDGFVKALNSFDNFRVLQSVDSEILLMGWLKKIMINCSIDELRKSKMMPEIGGIPEDVWDISDKHDNADHLLLYKDLIIIIKQLPPKYYLVLNLYILDGYSHLQIAEMLNISVGTSRSSLSRAKSMLQNLIRNMEEANYAGSRS